jgi:tRNA G37 N-methylase Trm5
LEEIKKYANQWSVSARFFYDNMYYQWMSSKLKDHKIVMELGCGTGYSTLELIKQGHQVIAIDKNHECIIAATKLISENGYNKDNVIFLEGDVTDTNFIKKLYLEYPCDIVVCWNIGTYWNKQMIQFYLPHMMEYGLTASQILENPESSYSELIIWNACKIAKATGVPIHIIDRSKEKINADTDPFYKLLKTDFNFSLIDYDNFEAQSLSNGGRVLTTNGEVHYDGLIDIILVSILMK